MADDLTAELAPIRDHLRVAEEHNFPQWDDAYIPAALYRSCRSLLAAVEAVLTLADEATPVVAALHCTCGAGSPDACTCQDTTVAWTLNPAKVREAITTALTRSNGDLTL